MTSKLNRGNGSYGDGASKPIHFFRIMLPDNLQQGKLRLPGKFVNKYGKQLSNTMFLKLPNGAEWKVNLKKRGGGVWFQEGWKEFVEYHSLAHGHLLFFRFDGTSCFHVFICDMSTMEIDYPVIKANHKRARINREEIQPRKTLKTNGNKKRSNSNLQDTAFHQNVRDHKGKILDS
ncbi:B3 domain-containing protein [Spatholobus suberectus]|nr:B3 domain-containing protein [Spatholobus suberectus]